VSAVPFRLQPCENPTEASLDALTFGDPSLYEKLLTLNRVEILAENPRVRAGTIWYRVDREFCFVEAVAIRTGLYPLVYKVLPEMMAAQLGFSYVGRYFNMTYGYSTRSLVWDENAIAENGARSFASVYPGMVPIVKLTAVIGGSTRTPILVRNDTDSAGAAADALLLSDITLANKLADVARLEIVTGSEGTRAGTIWYFRNGNYCFVIASAFRPEAPAEVVRLAPLLVAQFFGYSYVGNYTAIPADLKDKALCWDRYTGTPIAELAPLSQRLPGVQDFVVTFADAPPGNPNPDTDPYPPIECQSPSEHWGETGWNYDGCLWSESPSPGSDYYWTENPDNLGGYWTQSETPPPPPPPDYPPQGTVLDSGSNPITVNAGCGDWTVGTSSWATIADGNGGSNTTGGNSYVSYGTLLGNCNDYNYYADGNGNYYQGEYTGGGGGNYYPSYGTEIGTYSNNITVNVGCGDWVVGTDSGTTYADGNGGSYNSGSTSYVSSGTYIGNCSEQNYYSDGMGGYYTGA
jgi:hypothetical protein